MNKDTNLLDKNLLFYTQFKYYFLARIVKQLGIISPGFSIPESQTMVLRTPALDSPLYPLGHSRQMMVWLASSSWRQAPWFGQGHSLQSPWVPSRELPQYPLAHNSQLSPPVLCWQIQRPVINSLYSYRSLLSRLKTVFNILFQIWKVCLKAKMYECKRNSITVLV